jgi:glycosyltransferase involved in cell wall biosynthesis
VLYVNYPADRISILKGASEQRIKNRLESIRTGKNELTEVSENLYVLNPRIIVESINWIPFQTIYNKLNYRNNLLLSKEIIKASSKLEMSDPILIIDNDFLRGFYLPELIQHDLFLFYIRDYLLSQKYFKKHGKELEPGMIYKSDATVCNSSYLTDYAKKYNSNSYYIGQGCDVQSFLPYGKIPDPKLQELNEPVVGYCGALLAGRLDIDLISNLAKQHKEINFVFVGPEDETFKKSDLHHISNIIFTGPKPADELPDFINRFDVCINPQLLNEMTIGNYPRKIDEYLASGKPVVATATPAMEPFKEYVYLSSTSGEFSANIMKALNEKSETEISEKRISFAASHTWQASVSEMYKVILKLNKKDEHKSREVIYD